MAADPPGGAGGLLRVDLGGDGGGGVPEREGHLGGLSGGGRGALRVLRVQVATEPRGGASDGAVGERERIVLREEGALAGGSEARGQVTLEVRPGERGDEEAPGGVEADGEPRLGHAKALAAGADDEGRRGPEGDEPPGEPVTPRAGGPEEVWIPLGLAEPGPEGRAAPRGVKEAEGSEEPLGAWIGGRLGGHRGGPLSWGTRRSSSGSPRRRA